MSIVKDKSVHGAAISVEPLVDVTAPEGMSGRIALLIEHLGLETAAEITRKSPKQLKRYSAGAEPPFGVLEALVRTASASFDWVVFGKPRTDLDYELSLTHHLDQARELEAELQTDLSTEVRSDVKSLLHVTQELIALEEAYLEVRARRSHPRPENGVADLNQPGMVSIPRYDEVRPSAGHGAVATSETPTTRVAFERHWLTEIGVQADKAVILPAQGDSMEPTIMNGSPMLVDRSKTEIQNGFIYVIAVGNDLLVKRVRRRLDGRIDLISDNRAYDPETLDDASLQQLRVIGRVYAAVSKL